MTNASISAPKPVPSKPVRVLLVEDSLAVRQRIRLLIERTGEAAVIGEAESVQSAIACFHATRPDAVVLDLTLVDGDGATVLEEIKRTRPPTAVIVLTNNSVEAIRENCVALGADHVLDKSRDFELVPGMLAGLASRQPAA